MLLRKVKGRTFTIKNSQQTLNSYQCIESKSIKVQIIHPCLISSLQLNCCGLAVSDADAPWLIWRKNILLNSGDADSRVPDSCCLVNGDGKALDCSSSNTVDDTKIHRRDCYKAGLEFVQSHALILASVAIAGAAVMVSRVRGKASN